MDAGMPLPKQINKFVANVEEWQSRYLAAPTIDEKLAAAQGIRLWLHGVYREVDIHALNQPPGQRGKHREVLESLEKIIVALDRCIHILKVDRMTPTEVFKVDCEELRTELRGI